MKHKKIISFLSAAVIMVVSSITPVFVANASEVTEIVTEAETSIEEDAAVSEVVPEAEAEFLSQDEISIEDLAAIVQASSVAENSDEEVPELNVDEILHKGADNVSLTESNISLAGYDVESGISMGDLTSISKMRSAESITQKFTDFITSEDDIKLV